MTPRLLRAQNRSNPVTSTTRSSPTTETVAMSGSYRSFLWTRSAPDLTTQASAAAHRHRDTVVSVHAHPADSTNIRTCPWCVCWSEPENSAQSPVDFAHEG